MKDELPVGVTIRRCDECLRDREDVVPHDRYEVALCAECAAEVDSGERRLLVKPHARPSSRDCRSGEWNQYRHAKTLIASGMVPAHLRTTLLVVVEAFDRREGYGYHSQVEMAEMWGVGERTLRRHLNELEALGVIWRRPRRNTSRGKAGTRGRDEIHLCLPPIGTGHGDRLLDELPAVVAGSTGRGGRTSRTSTSSLEGLAPLAFKDAGASIPSTAPGEGEGNESADAEDGSRLEDCCCCGQEKRCWWIRSAWWCEPCVDFVLAEESAVPVEVGAAEPAENVEEDSDALAADVHGRVDAADAPTGAAADGQSGAGRAGHAAEYYPASGGLVYVGGDDDIEF